MKSNRGKDSLPPVSGILPPTSRYLGDSGNASLDTQKTRFGRKQARRFDEIDGDPPEDEDPATLTFLESVKTFFIGFLFSWMYVTVDNKKRVVLFLVGCSTLLIVVITMALVQNTLRKAPYIFLKISEYTTGEADFYILPKFTNSSQVPFLNSTEIREKLADNPYVQGITPRWMFQGFVRSVDADRMDRFPATLLWTNTDEEEEMGLGRDYPHRPLGQQECHVRQPLVWSIGARPNRGERFIVELNFNSLLSGLTGAQIAAEEGVIPDSEGDSDSDSDSPTIRDFLEDLGLNMTQEIFFDFSDIEGLEDLGRFELNQTVGDLIDLLAENFTTVDSLLDDLELSSEMILVDSVPSLKGKYPSAFGAVVSMDSRYLSDFFQSVLGGNTLLPLLMPLLGFEDGLDGINWEENALMVVGQYRDRFETYIQRQTKKQKALIEFTNSLVDSLGVDEPYQIELPTAQGLQMMDIIRLFLDQVFVGSTVCLAVLGTLLIFALLLANVEEKTYEYGMLRAMGLTQPTLIQMILVQAFYFTIPAIGVGMLVSFVVNIGLDAVFYYVIVLPERDYSFSWDAVVLPIGIGLLIPFISNVIPIRAALGKSLRNSLDIARQTFSETTVTFQKLENLGLEPWQTALAVVMIVVGFVVYYVMPLSFILDHIEVFFYTLEFIFIGMLGGLCLVAIVLEPYVERVLLEILLFINILCYHDRRMKSLVVKNLARHRARTRKAFLMFTLTIAFVVFAGSNFKMLENVVTGSIIVLVGSDLQVMSMNNRMSIRTDELDAFLDSEVAIGNVTSYAYITSPMHSMAWVDRTRLSNMASNPRFSVEVYGMEQNFLDPGFEYYFLPTEMNSNLKCHRRLSNGGCDLIDSLYTNAGDATVSGLKAHYEPSTIFSGRAVDVSEDALDDFDAGAQYADYFDVIVSESMRDALGVDAESPLLLQIRLGGHYYKYVAKPHGMLRKCPCFFFSSYGLAADWSPVFVSIPEWKRLAQTASDNYGAEASRDQFNGVVPYVRLQIEMGHDNSERHRAQFIDRIRVFLDSDFTMIQDTDALLKTASAAVIGFNALFYALGSIALIFCTYMLALGFISNVRDSQWVFGVLRSIGFTVNMLIRAYIYEAIVMVVAAFVIGTVIGVVVASTLIAQFNLFIEMPFDFDFPFDLVGTLSLAAVLLAILGSYLPARVIKTKEIAQVLRGLE